MSHHRPLTLIAAYPVKSLRQLMDLVSLDICQADFIITDTELALLTARLVEKLPEGVRRQLFTLDTLISPLMHLVAPDAVRKAYVLAYLYFHLEEWRSRRAAVRVFSVLLISIHTIVAA